MKGLLFWCAVIVVILVVYEPNKPDASQGVSPTISQHLDMPGYTDSAGGPTRTRSTFKGDVCTVDCGGHAAGYRWAEEHDIDDEEACETAGDNSNSPSFAEGCKAFVNGNSDDSQ